MPGRRIQLQVLPTFRKELPSAWLRRVAEAALSHGAKTNGASVETPSMSLVIADDDTIRQLNRHYRGLDEATDVLSFSSRHSGHYEGEGDPPAQAGGEPFVTPPRFSDFAGEVIISYPQCIRQAAALRRSPRDELALLITHGVLHLLGYDHAKPAEELAMQALERQALASLGIPERRP